MVDLTMDTDVKEELLDGGDTPPPRGERTSPSEPLPDAGERTSPSEPLPDAGEMAPEPLPDAVVEGETRWPEPELPRSLDATHSSACGRTETQLGDPACCD